MVTGNAINLSATGIARYDGAGNFSGVTVTQHNMLVGASANGITSLPLTNGQLPIGSTGADPVAATLTAGTGVSITNAAGSITIAANGGGLTWTTVTGTTQTAAVNNGYIANNAGLVIISLPGSASLGDVIAVTGINNATGWRIAQNANQQIFFGTSSTTPGVTGYLQSTATRDTVYLVCVVAGASTIYNVVSSIGNITVV